MRYVDSAQIHNPDPVSTHFVAGMCETVMLNSSVIEAERFDKDFAVYDKKIRETHVDKKHEKVSHLREERFQRDTKRWEQMEKYEKKEADRLTTRIDLY